MDQIKESAIIKICPELFREFSEETHMHVGFSCHNGWSTLLEDLTWQLKDICIKYKLKTTEYPSITQVKQKFATLRIHIQYKENTPEDFIGEVANAIAHASQISGTVCEICGEPGSLRDGKWAFTACDKHFNSISEWL